MMIWPVISSGPRTGRTRRGRRGAVGSFMSARNAAGRLVGFFAGGFIAGFNENLVNMALVAIMGEFSVDAMTAQWLVTGFMVVTVFVVATMAALYRRLGARTLLFVALVCNALGSAAGLVAPTFAVLLASRLVQAVGTGIFIPLMMNAILETVASEKLGTYLAVGNGMIALGPAVAPVATGALVGIFGWRSVFVVPLAASALIGLWGLVAVRPSRRGGVQGNVVSLRGVLLNRGFVTAALLVVLTMSIYFSLNVMGPLYLEECARLGPALSGLCLGPLVVAYAVASLAGGRWLDRRGPVSLLSRGLAGAAAGSGLMAVAAWMASEIALLAGMLVVFVGCGTVCANFQTTGLRCLALNQHSLGVTIMTMAVQIAASIGPFISVGAMSGIQGMVGEAQSALGYEGAWLLAALVCAMGSLLARWACRNLWRR